MKNNTFSICRHKTEPEEVRDFETSDVPSDLFGVRRATLHECLTSAGGRRHRRCLRNRSNHQNFDDGKSQPWLEGRLASGTELAEEINSEKGRPEISINQNKSVLEVSV